MIVRKMLALGKSASAIRTIAAYGDKRRSEIGSENVFDFSIGNPSVPAPDKVKDTLIELLRSEESPCPSRLHRLPRRYGSAQGGRRAGEQKSRL